MPVPLDCQANYNETHDHDDGRRVRDGKARFGKNSAVMTLCVERAEGVMHPVSNEPTERHACNAEEIEETLGTLAERLGAAYIEKGKQLCYLT